LRKVERSERMMVKVWALLSEWNLLDTCCLSKGQADIGLGLFVVERDAQVRVEAKDHIALAA
jgi:hypothetical protein